MRAVGESISKREAKVQQAKNSNQLGKSRQEQSRAAAVLVERGAELPGEKHFLILRHAKEANQQHLHPGDGAIFADCDGRVSQPYA
jgi:hypothetical protein